MGLGGLLAQGLTLELLWSKGTTWCWWDEAWVLQGGRDALGMLDTNLSSPQHKAGAQVLRAEVFLLKDAPRTGVPISNAAVVSDPCHEEKFQQPAPASPLLGVGQAP